ncbi:MAG: type II secretion system F family protein [Acidimicrobiia bacterium]|nr:type II secretion system F family protein [Acidimicrobiia bacterium]
MSPLFLVAGITGWAGATVLLGEIRWIRRPRLLVRVAPYQVIAHRRRSAGPLSVETLREVLGPVVTTAGGAMARGFGVTDPLTIRLARAHDPRPVIDFRLHQTAWSAAAFTAAVSLTLVTGTPMAVTALLAVIAPLLAFLLIEQDISSAADRHRRRITDELPVVSEQLAMLLQAGFSLNGCLSRLTHRGSGAISDDLAGVTRRVQQGLSVTDALHEWANLMDIESLDRVVALCALDREVNDVGPLMSDEARSIRLQTQRELLEVIERRNEQVWVPVTVATLVPGLMLLAIPFVDALRTFSVGA